MISRVSPYFDSMHTTLPKDEFGNVLFEGQKIAPFRRGYFSQPHEQIVVRVNNLVFPVDEKIATGIVNLNKEGFYTLYSCQGDDILCREFAGAYVSFANKCPKVLIEQNNKNGGHYDIDKLGRPVLYAGEIKERNIDQNLKFREMLNNWQYYELLAKGCNS